jgi:DNA-directed RNA polymerase subunit E'/Rpb7
VSLSARQLSSTKDGSGSLLSDQVTDLLRRQVEGRCIAQGFVRPGSVCLRSLSAGLAVGADIHFTATFRADVLQPLEGTVVRCNVLSVTKAGLHCSVYDKRTDTQPLTVFISRKSHEDPISNAQPGDTIRATIYASTFQVDDVRICALAHFCGAG